MKSDGYSVYAVPVAECIPRHGVAFLEAVAQAPSLKPIPTASRPTPPCSTTSALAPQSAPLTATKPSAPHSTASSPPQPGSAPAAARRPRPRRTARLGQTRLPGHKMLEVKCPMILLRNLVPWLCAAFLSVAMGCIMSSDGKVAFLEEARRILRGEYASAKHAQLVQPSYALSNASTNPVTPEVWALTIVALQGNTDDVTLVEPYLKHRDPQTMQAATNCMSFLQSRRQPPTQTSP